jgi:hypothetical protein
MTKGDRNRIVGLVRFSYPSIGGFAHGSPDPARFLYDPARLERRFRLFEALCLPALCAQTDPDFDIVFLVGNDMPSAARKRLEAALGPLRHAHVVALPHLQHYPALRQAYGTVQVDDAETLTTFRLDDDDALSRDYISRLRALSAGLAGMGPLEAPLTLSFHRGFLLHPDGALSEVVEKLPPASGSAMLVPFGHRDNIYRRNHRLLPQFFSHFSDAGRPAFLRSIHQDNDSSPHASGLSTPLAPQDAAAALREAFPFALDSLRGL